MYQFLRHALRLLPVLLAATVVTAADKSGYTLANPVPASLLRELSTDRPDQTESPYTVDAGHWQLEMDLVNYTSDRDRSGGNDVQTREFNLAALNLKLGLTNRMDLQLMIDPLVSRRSADRMTGSTDRASGLGEVTTRLKFNFWGNDGGPTAFAIMPFVKWPLPDSDIRNGETEGGVIFILGYELPGGWGSAVMTEFDQVADGAGGHNTEWINSITFAHDLTARLGGYIELFTIMSDAQDFRWQAQLDLGLTYAVMDHTQIDIGCNFGVTASAPDFQPFVGFSRRF